MNIEYKYDKGDQMIVVFNEKGNLNLREYQDNIAKILIEENIIEDTDIKLNKYREEEKNLNEKLQGLLLKIEKKKKEKKRTIKKAIFLWLGAQVFGTLLIYFVFGNWQINTIFGSIKSIYSNMIGFSIISTTLTAAFIGPKYMENWMNNPNRNYENTKEQLNIVQMEITILEKMLKKSEKKLASLQENKSREKEALIQSNSQIMQVDYRTILEQRKTELESMYQNHSSLTKKLSDSLDQ